MKYIVTLNGKNYEVDVEETEAVITGVTDVQSVPAQVSAPTAPQVTQAPTSTTTVPVSGSKATAPMPGTILSVSATVGQSVKKGDVLMILEAMKMENEIVSPADGTVSQVLVQKGSTVETGSVLAVIG